MQKGSSTAENDIQIIDLTKNLKNIDNMIYIVGEETNFSYFIANHATDVTSGNTNFYIGNVSNGHIGCGGYGTGPMFVTHSSGGFNCGPCNGAIRPIIILPSSIKVQELSSGVYDIEY